MDSLLLKTAEFFEDPSRRLLAGVHRAQRGEDLQVWLLPDGERVFVDVVSRTYESKRKKDNWAISVKSRNTKDWLVGLGASVFLLLVESDDIGGHSDAVYLLKYKQGHLTYQSYPEPFYLIEAGYLHKTGCADIYKCGQLGELG